MYLKCLEMIGFKSFADATRLDFEPGITCIVGPNGCGKSNISDAIRWVLGEQSAKAIRGTKMEDCIFNGTDTRKPLGMCEVSITFADCEGTLGTEYNEVTVTRRVFRSGEGQYFLNKTPCRLKDIQRLFMDTGIGTSSYSIMEQGRIDQILSARPEDRRAVFEEASGITKFKADKKEAIRKLEYTEANLLRLADVIREVKRQIGSLQRQAAKARRYEELRAELRRFDVFATRLRIRVIETELKGLEARLGELDEAMSRLQREVTELEHGIAALQASLLDTEREIGLAMETGGQAQSRLDHTREIIKLNRKRIEEYGEWSERDSREIAATQEQIARQTTVLEELRTSVTKLEEEYSSAETLLRTARERLTAHVRRIEESRSRVARLEEESVDTESRLTRLQNELLELDSQGRTVAIRRERLAAEKNQLLRALAAAEKREAETEKNLQKLRQEETRAERALEQLREEKRKVGEKLSQLQQTCSELRMQAAAREAALRVLDDTAAADQDLPSGARFLLEKGGSHRIDFSCVLGTLASHVDVEPDYRTAFEATLRAWLDAVVISDTENALHVLRILDKERAGAARILVAEVSAPAGYSSNCGEGEPLASHVRCTDRLAPFLQRLLSGVRVVDSLDNIPCQIPQGVTYVTRSGCVVRPGGEMEFWMRPQQPDNPFSRKHLVEYTREELESIRSRILETENKIKGMLTLDQALDETLRDAEARAIEARRALAQGEGANQVLVREVALVRERLETVTWELASLENQDGTTGDKRRQIEENLQVLRSQREQLAAALAEENRRLREFETEQDKITAEVTEHRIRVNSLGEKLGHLRAQYETGEKRLHELRLTVESRSAGLLSYQEGIRKLTEEIRSAEQQLSTLEAEVLANQEKAEALRKNREKQIEELRAMEHGLTAKRQELEALRTRKTGAEVARAECLMRRQNQIDRLTSEYGITLETALQEPDPEYEGTTPSLETAETVVAEIKAKIEAMGPVNLVAIQEYKELEERHRFLTEQEQDLVRSKHQLMEMIRRINRTTTEMFSTTFAKINENFQTMFQKFFDGGQAKLVLVNEEDVLECGIEIIARPPGKRLTNISLLSGGERTLTAVALLFAIYMIKPSPFCMLDELDAALDETNIMRFVRLLQEFRQQSQFVVITHNRQTIAEADVLYGVTMEEKGVSKIVSMRFSDYETGSPPTGRAATPAVQDGR